MTATVLVIEDDCEIAKVITGHLRGAGYRTLTAADGETGIALARRERVDLITLDVLMTPVDGRTVLRRLRGDDVTAAIPVVLVTVVDQRPGDPTADGYVSKPFRGRRLLSEVGRLVPSAGSVSDG